MPRGSDRRHPDLSSGKIPEPMGEQFQRRRLRVNLGVESERETKGTRVRQSVRQINADRGVAHMNGATIMRIGTRARAQKPPHDPLSLIFALCDGCMHMLGANAWKVVIYVGRRNVEAYAAANDPMNLLRSDLSKILPELADRAFGCDQPDAAHLEGVQGRSQFPVLFTPISLQQFCQGRRLPKGGYSDAGTGLSKSSVTDALKEALEKGMILRKRQSGWQGKALTSSYAVNWEKVFELVGKLKKRRSPKRAR